MSSRVLRKLGLQGEIDISCVNDDASDTEADFSSSSGAKKKQLNKNRYDLLNPQSHSESEVKEDDDHETAGSLNNQEGAIDLKDASRRKKKRKKKKTGKVSSSNARSSEDNIEDEVERSVREVNAMLGEAPAPSAQAASGSESSLRRGVLSIEHRQLNPNNELRRIFGSKILQNEQVKKRGRSRGHLRSTFLVSPKENWPPIGKPGLSMKLVECKNGLNYFSYEHSLNYQQVQIKFLNAVESLNPDNIVSIINMSPYHVDGLLQLSELSRLSEDLSMAAELVQRALYSLEMAFHPSFSLVSGASRLDYRKQENRSLYIGLLKHALFLGSRACYRTALEFCKLILTLDDKDPLAVVLVVDFFALRAQEYDWLIRLANEWEATRNLSQLPNFAYSTAMAHFHVEGETETSDRVLQEALIKFPGVLLPLMEKCGAVVDSRVSTSPFFATARSRQSKTLSQLEGMYVERCYHAWKEGEFLPWLERNSHAVLDRVDRVAEAASEPQPPPPSQHPLDQLIPEWKEARLKRFQSTPRNISRHIILSDLKETNLLLDDEYHMPVLNFDPLPPLDSIDSYQRPTRATAVDNEGPLATFFRSIIPNFRLNQPAALLDTNEPGGAGGGAGGGGDDRGLRHRTALLLEALRDLLSNIHLPDVPADGDVEDADSDDPQH